MYLKVDVSYLEVRKDPKKSSRIFLSSGSVVEPIGEAKKSRNQFWIPIMTLNEPKISGYVQKKYLSEL